MKTLFQSASVLVADLASTFIFLAVILMSPYFPPVIRANVVPIGIVAGMVFGVGQIGFEYARKKPIGTMQWLSLVLVIGFSGRLADHPRSPFHHGQAQRDPRHRRRGDAEAGLDDPLSAAGGAGVRA